MHVLYCRVVHQHTHCDAYWLQLCSFSDRRFVAKNPLFNSVKHPPNNVVFVCVLFSICDLVFFMSNSLAFLILVSFDVCVLSNLFDGVRCSSSFWQIRTHNGNLVNHSFNSCCYVRLYNFVKSHVNASSVAKRPTPRIVRYITMDPNGN